MLQIQHKTKIGEDWFIYEEFVENEERFKVFHIAEIMSYTNKRNRPQEIHKIITRHQL